MAHLDLADIRGFVREHLELDEDELSNPILDRFIADGAERIESYSRSWSFRAVDYTFNALPNIQSYNISGSDADLWPGITKRVVDITDLRASRWSLRPVDHRQAREMFRTTSPQSSEPTRWSRFGDSIYLWPIPSTQGAISISGYRAADDLISAADVPDLPHEFHELICWWALGRGYAQQDDTELADFYRQEFEAQLRRRAARYVAGNEAQPLQMNVGMGTSAGWRYAGGPILDWE